MTGPLTLAECAPLLLYYGRMAAGGGAGATSLHLVAAAVIEHCYVMNTARSSGF
jgi:hypothetical protein